MNDMTGAVYSGKRLLRRLKDGLFRDGHEYIVFLFSGDRDIDCETLRMLPVFRKSENVTRFLIVCPDRDMEAMVRAVARVPYRIGFCNTSEAHDIGRYCTETTRWKRKAERFLINGSDDTEDHRYRGLLGVNGIDAADIAAMTVFDFGYVPNQAEIDEAVSYTPVQGRGGEYGKPAVWETETGSLDEWELSLEKGKRIYDSIRSEHPRARMYLCTYPGSGDIYITGLYLRDRMRHDGVTECVIVVASEGSRRLLELFRFGDAIKQVYVLAGRPECNSLLFFVRNIGFDAANSGLLSNDYGLMRLERMSGVRGTDFNTMFQKVVFFSDERRTYADIRAEDSGDIFVREGLRPGKTILLAPYANTAVKISLSMWEDVAENLVAMGYDVVTNVSGMSEAPIHGTRAVVIPYAKIVDFLDKAGGFVGLRSGLCDIISGSRAKKVILYPDGVTFHWSTCLNYFSLRKMYDINENLTELEVGEKCVDMTNEILDVFKEGDS